MGKLGLPIMQAHNPYTLCTKTPTLDYTVIESNYWTLHLQLLRRCVRISTDFQRRLTVCYGQLTYGAEVPSTPGPTCLIDEIVWSPMCVPPVHANNRVIFLSDPIKAGRQESSVVEIFWKDDSVHNSGNQNVKSFTKYNV